MSDVATATAAAVRERGPYVVVTGRPTPGVASLVAAAQRHVVSAGPTTRLAVAAGVALGGHRCVAVVESGCAFGAGHGTLAVTESRTAAREALRSGWSVVQPWRGPDVAPLLRVAPVPCVILLPRATEGREAAPEGPAAGDLRVWREGPLATVVASGAAVGPLLDTSARLAARGVSVTALEVAVLTSPDHAPLIGGDAMYVGGPDAGDDVARGAWPRPLQRVATAGVAGADLVGSVLSHIGTR